VFFDQIPDTKRSVKIYPYSIFDYKYKQSLIRSSTETLTNIHKNMNLNKKVYIMEFLFIIEASPFAKKKSYSLPPLVTNTAIQVK
jgi:hypothetical protein